MHTYVNTYIYTYIHTYIHRCTHTLTMLVVCEWPSCCHKTHILFADIKNGFTERRSWTRFSSQYMHACSRSSTLGWSSSQTKYHCTHNQHLDRTLEKKLHTLDEARILWEYENRGELNKQNKKRHVVIPESVHDNHSNHLALARCLRTNQTRVCNDFP